MNYHKHYHYYYLLDYFETNSRLRFEFKVNIGKYF